MAIYFTFGVDGKGSIRNANFAMLLLYAEGSEYKLKTKTPVKGYQIIDFTGNKEIKEEVEAASGEVVGSEGPVSVDDLNENEESNN